MQPFARLIVVLLALAFGTAASAAPDDVWDAEPARSALDAPPDIRRPTDHEGRRIHEGALAAGVLGNAVRDADAVRHWREVIAISEATFGPNHPDTAHWYFRLGVRYADMGQPADAAAYLKRALAIQRARLHPRHTNIAWTLSALAGVLGPVEAEPILLELSARAAERTLHARRRLARLLEEIATDLAQQNGRGAEASTLRTRARALADPKLDDAALDGAIGPIAPTVIGPIDTDPTRQPPFMRALTPAEHLKSETLHAQAMALDATGRAADASAVWRALIELDAKTWGEDHPVTATHWLKFGGNLKAQDNVPGATTAFTIARQAGLRTLGTWHTTTVRATLGLAQMNRAQGAWAQAETLHRELLASFQEGVRLAVFDDARALTDLAANVAKSFRHAEAERYFRRAAALHRVYWRQDFGPALVDLAANLEAQGRLAEAEAMFAKAIALPVSPTANKAEVAALRSRLAFVKFAQGKSEGVEATLRQTLQAYEAWYGPAQYKTSEALADLGWFMLKTKQFAKAEPFLTRAAAIRETILGLAQPRTLQALQQVATAHLALNRPEQALATARRVLAGRLAASRAAAQAANDALRNDIGARTGTAARTLVRAAWTVAARAPAQDPRLRAEAFGHAQAIEQSAAADALSRGAARLLAGRAGAGPFVRAWSDTLARIDWLTAKMTAAAAQGPKGDAERTRLAGDLRAAIAARDDAEKALAASYPAYFELLRPQSVPVADLQATAGENARLLRSDEALILLYPGDAGMIEGQRNGLVFVVTKTATAWAEIAMAPDELKRHIATIHKQLAEGGATLKPGDDPESLQGFERQRAYLVYRALFGNPKIQTALRGHTRWLLAPQGTLVGLPFAVLVTEPPPGGEERDADPAALRKTAWLGLNRTLALVPSVGVLKLQRLKVATAIPAAPRFFGLGDPAFRGVPDPPPPADEATGTVRAFVRRNAPKQSRDYFRSGAGDPKRIAELARLPQTANEIRALAKTFKASDADYVLQLKSNEAELRRRNKDLSLLKADVIAFATHGLVAGDLEETLTEPALVLTPPLLAPGRKPSAENDGLLTASEAADLSLSARWVILSACNTAAGNAGSADSLTGLARAFLFAGAQSLLVSHYPILDKSAMYLTTEAVANARDKAMRRPEALRAAMAKLIRDESRDAAGASFAHPSAWAPFAIIDAN